MAPTTRSSERSARWSSRCSATRLPAARSVPRRSRRLAHRPSRSEPRPLRAAAATVAVVVGVSAAACAVLGAAVAIVAHGSADPPVARDAVASAYAGALGGAAYASLFVLGSTFGRRGGGRTVALVADWLLGANATAVAFVTPRAHLR